MRGSVDNTLMNAVCALLFTCPRLLTEGFVCRPV